MRSPIIYGSLALVMLIKSVYATPFLDAYREGNYELAKEIFTSQSLTDGPSLYSYAKMQLYGYAIPRNNNEAVKYFQMAAEKKDLNAILWMAKYNLNIQDNPTEALKWFKLAAAQNDISSQLYVVGAYLFGYGVQKNEDAARSYYIAAAKNGNPLAQYMLAQHFLESKHTTNQKLGISWLNKALDKGLPEAELLYGQMLLEGKIFDKDLAKGHEYIRKAVARNYAVAFKTQAKLALADKNLEDAKAWYTRAINAKVYDADVDLANFYLENKEFKKSYLVLLKASLNGSKSAQAQLANLYEEGLGVDLDKQVAQQWRTKSKQTEDSKITKERMALWLTHNKTSDFMNTQYRLGGILQDWRNKDALKENILNKPPKLEILAKDDIFKPDYSLIKAQDLPLSMYYNVWSSYHKPAELDSGYPQYTLNITDKDIAYLKKRADVGDPLAQFSLGLFYQTSSNDDKNNAELAVKYLKLAAEQQELRAQYQLALLYLLGSTSLAEDKKRAVELLRDAALKGNDYAETVLARLYLTGIKADNGSIILPQSVDEATSFYYLAASNGYGEAKYELANLLLQNKEENVQAQAKQQALIEELYKQAFEEHVTDAALPLAFFDAMSDDTKRWDQAFVVAEKEAQYGNDSAKLLLALLYDRGIGVDKDTSTAYKYYKDLPDNPISNFILGTYALQDNDFDTGVDLLQKAAALNFAPAYFNLAIAKHDKNEDFVSDLEEALQRGNTRAGLLLADYAFAANNNDMMQKAKSLYEKLANEGLASAQFKMGYIAQYGLGMKPDFNAAFNWYNLAAAQGLQIAQYSLGNMYQFGLLDNKVDVANAKIWYKASGDFIYSQLALGYMSEVVEENYKKALLYYKAAADSGNKDAEFNLKLIYYYGKGVDVNLELTKDI